MTAILLGLKKEREANSAEALRKERKLKKKEWRWMNGHEARLLHGLRLRGQSRQKRYGSYRISPAMPVYPEKPRIYARSAPVDCWHDGRQ